MNKEHELISVIVPMYNTEKTIEETVHSLLIQTYSHIEVILINDGSTDRTADICDQFLKQDERVRYYYQKNRGEGAARNTGIDYAKGELITFVDGDDTLPRDAIETLYVHKEHPLVIGGISKLENGKYRQHIPDESVEDREGIVEYVTDRRKMYFINTVWAKLFRTEIIRQNALKFPDFKFGEDTAFIYQYLQYIDSMYVIGKIVYNVIAIENSMSKRKVHDAWKIMRTLYEMAVELLDEKDEKSRFLLMDRSIRQTLILQSRFSFNSFAMVCGDMKDFVDESHISYPGAEMTMYQKFVWNGIKKCHRITLFFAFKMRRILCTLIRK